MKIFVVSKRTLLIVLAIIVVLVLAIVLIASAGKPDNGADSPTTTNKHDGALNNSPNNTEQYELDVLAGLHKELPVYCVSRDDKTIALTIDAAWQDDKTPFILETLKKYNIKATFFLCGFWAEDYPEQVKQIHDAGHQIGNHSATHPHMNKLSAQQIVDELKKFDDCLEAIIGQRSTIFRAPYGEYNDNVIKTVRNAGYEVIQWDIDTIDWKEERSAQQILDTVLPKLKDGSIILCHNNGYKIETYLPTLLEAALKQGYRFVTIDELLLDGNTVIDVNGMQKPAE